MKGSIPFKRSLVTTLTYSLSLPPPVLLLLSADFKYYEDVGDEYRESIGQLLPLWRFKYEKARKYAVTDISWNPLYKDLFAVGHGSCKNAWTCYIMCVHVRVHTVCGKKKDYTEYY